MNKKLVVTAVVTAMMLFSLATNVMAGPLSKIYYRHFPTTETQAVNRYGQPLMVQDLPDGAKKLVFSKIQNAMDLGYHYVIVKDGMVVDNGITTPPKNLDGRS